MTAALPLHHKELEQCVAVLQLAIQDLRATYATDTIARADVDAVWHDAAKLRAHLEGVRIEIEYARGRS